MSKNLNFNSETVSAIFIIAFVSLFILANFTVGFVLPLFLLAMTIASGIAFFYPRSGIYSIVFLTFIFERFFTLQPVLLGRAEYKLYPLDIILGAIILGIIFELLTAWKPRFQLKRTDYFLLAFIVLAAVYFIVSAFVMKNDFYLSFSSLKHYAFYPLLYFVILKTFENKKQIIKLFEFAFAGAFVIIFFVLYGLINGAGLWSEFTPLSTEGVRTLAFTHAFYLSLTLLGLITYLIFSEKNNTMLFTGRRQALYKNIFWILILIWIIGIIGSMMRHLWVALILSLIFLYFILPSAKKINFEKLAGKTLIAVAITAILIIYISAIFPGSDFKESIDSTGSVLYSRAQTLANATGDESFFWRNIVWREALKEYLKSPILGIGLGKTLSIEIENYRDFIEVRNIHNSLLVILVQLGIAGLALFLIIAFKLGKSLQKKRDKNWVDVFLQISLIFYFIVFLFQPYLETNLLGIFFWMILGFIRVQAYENIGNQ